MHPDTFTNYLAQLYPPKRSRFIQASELKEFVPVVDDAVARVMGLLIRLIKARRVLEIGTSIGFSTVQIAEAMEHRDGRVVTVEFDPLVAEQALKNFQRCGMQDRIQLLAGDAMDIVPRLCGTFDAIFLDVDKQLYPPLLQDCIRLLRPGGLLMAEDTLFPIMDLEPRWHSLVPPIATFNRMLAEDPRMDSYLLPVGDGLTLAWKRDPGK